jgi:hypothetical protein
MENAQCKRFSLSSALFFIVRKDRKQKKIRYSGEATDFQLLCNLVCQIVKRQDAFLKQVNTDLLVCVSHNTETINFLDLGQIRFN